jgi:hypothetical protein
VKPTISGFSLYRSNSSGTAADEGTYATVKFSLTTSKTATAVTIEHRQSGATTWTSVTVASSGTSGNVTKTLSTFNTEKTYDFRITVNDGTNSIVKSGTLTALKFLIDLKSGGDGIAFGKPAELSNVADFEYEVMMRNKLTFPNNKCIYGTKPDGTVFEAINLHNASGNLVFGYDNYDKQDGNTNVYGYDINIGVSNIANPGTYRPYRRRGDSIAFTIRTAGYVTNSGKEVSFLVPLAAPIVGSPTVTVTSGNGFTLRQGSKYTHGSTASSFATPTSYTASIAMWCGVYITATFSDTTNVTNNDSIGIYWNGTITFS